MCEKNLFSLRGILLLKSQDLKKGIKDMKIIGQ